MGDHIDDQEALQEALLSAVEEGSVEHVEQLLARNASVAHSFDGWTVLHACAAQGNEHVMRLLLERQANVDATDQSLSTPLIHAAGAGNTECVRILLSSRADVNALDSTSSSALIHATTEAHLDIVEMLLLHGADKRICTVRLTLVEQLHLNVCQADSIRFNVWL